MCNLNQNFARATVGYSDRTTTGTRCPVRLSAAHFRVSAPRIFSAFNLSVISPSMRLHRIRFSPSHFHHRTFKMGLLNDSSLGVVTKDNLVNWSAVIGADVAVNLGLTPQSASGSSGTQTMFSVSPRM